MSSTLSEEDLGWKVEDSLARFDKAVRESSNPDTLGDEDRLYQASSSTSTRDIVTDNSGDILKGTRLLLRELTGAKSYFQVQHGGLCYPFNLGNICLLEL